MRLRQGAFTQTLAVIQGVFGEAGKEGDARTFTRAAPCKGSKLDFFFLMKCVKLAPELQISAHTMTSKSTAAAAGGGGELSDPCLVHVM